MKILLSFSEEYPPEVLSELWVIEAQRAVANTSLVRNSKPSAPAVAVKPTVAAAVAKPAVAVAAAKPAVTASAPAKPAVATAAPTVVAAAKPPEHPSHS